MRKKKSEGWVKLPRAILEWSHYNDGNMLKTYLYLLLNAAWERTVVGTVTLKRGQLAVNVTKLASILGMSRKELRTCFDKLKDNSMIESELIYTKQGEATQTANQTATQTATQTANQSATQSANRIQVVTICNYDSYSPSKNDERPLNRPLNRPTERPLNRPLNRPTTEGDTYLRKDNTNVLSKEEETPNGVSKRRRKESAQSAPAPSSSSSETQNLIFQKADTGAEAPAQPLPPEGDNGQGGVARAREKPEEGRPLTAAEAEARAAEESARLLADEAFLNQMAQRAGVSPPTIRVAAESFTDYLKLNPFKTDERDYNIKLHFINWVAQYRGGGARVGNQLRQQQERARAEERRDDGRLRGGGSPLGEYGLLE